MRLVARSSHIPTGVCRVISRLRFSPRTQADNSQLQQAVHKLGWDDYCDHMELESTSGDALCLLAVSEFLGTHAPLDCNPPTDALAQVCVLWC